VAGCCECGDEPSGSWATELVSSLARYWPTRSFIKIRAVIGHAKHKSLRDYA
jgi:hypothetical protein